LLFLQEKLRAQGVPFPQGTSIVALTACVKLATFPFTKKQVESGMAMQNLQPQIKALRERWAGDENSQKLNSELNALYQRFGVNPLAGCFPVLLTLPVFWGLYRALLNGSADGAFKEQFWWVPSLAGPTYDKFPGNTVRPGACVLAQAMLTHLHLALSSLGRVELAVAAQRGRRAAHWCALRTQSFLARMHSHARALTRRAAPLRLPAGWENAQAYLVLPIALIISQARAL
jgi:YidC/Oxa1 family membrane protein insertase